MKNILFLNTIQDKAWKNRALFLMLALVMSIGNAWGHGGPHYGKAVLQNATGHGTVYLSTVSGNNTGQMGSNNPGAKDGTSWITWDCGDKSEGDSKTYYARGTANDGYYYAGWAGNSSATSYTASTTGKSFSTNSTQEGSPTTTTIYGFFKPVTVTGAPANVNINATDPSATYNDIAGTVVSFTTANSNKIGDFTTSESGDARWVISTWTRANASSTTFNYKFVGDGSYGETDRTFTKTVTLTSKGDASSTRSCTLTAQYPNPKVIACDEAATDLAIYPIFKATDDEAANIKESTAVFDVKYADNGNNFTATFSNATGGGEWIVTGISVDQAKQKATVSYTFSGKKIIGTHTAQLTLTANDCNGWDDTEAAGEQSVTIALTAHNEQEAVNDARVIAADGTTIIYEGNWATAWTTANTAANAGCTLVLVRDVSGLAVNQTVTNTFTLDLNGKKVTGAKNGSLLHINKAGITLTIKDSKTGGVLQNIYPYAGNVYCINCTAGNLIIESGTIYTENKGAADRKAFSILQRKGTTITMNGGKLGAAGYSEAYGVYQVYNETNETDNTIFTLNGGVIDVTGYTKTMGIYSAGKININAGTINATATYSGAYGIYMDAFSAATAANCYYGTLTIKGGTINSKCTSDADASRPAYGIYFDYATSPNIATALGTIENAIINVSTLGQKACGIFAAGSYQSKTSQNNTIQIKNTKIDVTSKYSTIDYITEGIRIDVDKDYAACYAQMELENCDIKVRSTSGAYVYGVYTNAVAKTVSSVEKAVASKVNINGGTYTITAATSNAYGIYAPNRAVSTNKKATAAVEMTIRNINLDVSTNSTITAVGIRTAGSSTIEGVNIKARTQTTTSYGIIVCDQEETTITNTTIDASGTGTIYGIYVNASAPNTTNGYEWHGKAILEAGNNVTARATTGNTSYAIYVHSNKAGTYINAGEVLINDGKYKATASGTTAYAVHSAAKQIQGEKEDAPAITINDGKFWAEASSTYADISSACVPGYCVIKGGYYKNDANIDTRLGEGAFKFALKSDRTEYTEGYRWLVTTDVTGEAVWEVYNNTNTLLGTFDNLNSALDFAKDKTNSKVVPTTNYTLPAGNYTIPSGVTLLIPYDGNYNLHDNAERISAANNAPSCFRTLYMALGTEIIVQGRLEVGGVQNNGGQTNTAIGAPRAHGKIKMAKGSSITLNNGSHLYCWGYIVGAEDNSEGTITAESGSQIDECLQLRDWKGGSASVEIQDNSYGVFPINQYYVQNIEVSITYLYGAKSFVSTGMFVVVPENIPFLGGKTFYGNADHVKFIGNSKNDGLFNLVAEGSFLTRDYDELTDRMIYQLNGDFSFDELNIQMDATFTNVNIESKNFLLPIVNNMTLHIKSGTTTVNSKLLLSPGAEIYIQQDAKAIANKDIYVFDKDQWLGYEGTKIFPLLYANETEYAATASGTKKQYIRQWKDVQDAKICVDGTLQITQNLYTTESGANICSTNKGKVIFNKEAPEPGVVYQVTNPTPTYESETANPAWLHNDEEWYKDKDNEFKKEYLATEDTPANTTITYANNHWGWMEIWKDHNDKILKINNTCAKVNNSSAYTPEDPTTFIGWSTEIDETNQEVTHIAQYIDIVDADGTYLTINTNGWASSGWPYTINNTLYEKTARQPDRTLVIPYDGQPNDDMAIEVKNYSDKVISNHSYKVPFVYTSKEDMSAMNNNSIVFVKSGTLSIEGTASAKEIYVADSAELKVTGTLTVGKLVLRTTPYKAAILTNNGTINGQVYYSRIARDTDFHLFAIPAGSNTANVVLSDGTSAAVASTVAPYGNAWQLREYNTARRAAEGATGANWDNIGVNGDGKTYSDVAIEASKGYELRSGSKYYREYLFPITLPTTATEVVVVSATGAAGAAHAGWNILCSPYTGIYTVENYNDPATAIKVCWQQTDGSYIQEQPKQIKPAVPFAYQTMKNGSLDFSASSFIFKAPRKQSAAEALTETEWIHLDIYDAYGDGDETSLFAHPTRFEQTYKTGIDVAKQSITAARPIIYSTHAYGDMAFAGIADSLLENGIDIAVYSPSAQELTFSLRENKFLNRLEYLWLADNETGARTDLLMDDYTCRANAGTIKGRFVLNGRFKAPQISTGIGNTNTQTDYNIYAIGNNIAISGVEQGTPIYVFDAVGHMIYTTSAISDEVIVPAPCAGVYMLTIGGQTAKLVINQ